jgi:hypothetical protein
LLFWRAAQRVGFVTTLDDETSHRRPRVGRDISGLFGAALVNIEKIVVASARESRWRSGNNKARKIQHERSRLSWRELEGMLRILGGTLEIPAATLPLSAL